GEPQTVCERQTVERAAERDVALERGRAARAERRAERVGPLLRLAGRRGPEPRRGRLEIIAGDERLELMAADDQAAGCAVDMAQHRLRGRDALETGDERGPGPQRRGRISMATHDLLRE